eukprot:5081645-Lingulodinium_polyedra.AAC.1
MGTRRAGNSPRRQRSPFAGGGGQGRLVVLVVEFEGGRGPQKPARKRFPCAPARGSAARPGARPQRLCRATRRA